MESPLSIFSTPAQRFWDAEYLRKLPGLTMQDDRPGAPLENIVYVGDSGQVGFFIHGYKSAWLPKSLLQEGERQKLTEAVFSGLLCFGVRFFDPNWKVGYWGPNFDRLANVKKRYDPEGLFFTIMVSGAMAGAPTGSRALGRS
jgi:hypothetical protein